MIPEDPDLDPCHAAIEEVIREIAPTTALRMSLALAYVRLRCGGRPTDRELQEQIVRLASARHIAIEFDMDERSL